jgi:hypothetical protein
MEEELDVALRGSSFLFEVAAAHRTAWNALRRSFRRAAEASGEEDDERPKSLT